MKLNNPFSLLLCLLIFTGALANPHDTDSGKDRNLRFDPPLNPNIKALHFDIKEILNPKPNDFELTEAAPMSNELGERWVLITLFNTASGQRLLKNENIVVTFANGDQSYAKELDETLKAKESLTKAVFFGRHRFPIIRVDVGR